MTPKTAEKHTPTGHIRLVLAWFGLAIRVEVQVRVTKSSPWAPYRMVGPPTYYWRRARVSDFFNPAFKATGRPYATSESR